MKKLLYILMIISMVACAPRRPAKVDEVGTKPHRTHTSSNSRHSSKQTKPSTHRVIKGDSLYSIGFRYRLDYKTLAQINNIEPPYRIYPNQILKLSRPKGKVFKPSKNMVVQTRPLTSNKPINAKVDSQPKTSTNKTVSKTNQPINKKNTQVTDKPPAKKPLPVKTPNNTNLNWLWPTQGKIRTTFLASNPARKGISIGGKEGQPVMAAEAGVVVYSGNGLLGYGELVIIKHNESYLSAYGHNKTLKVTEGQTVTRGQVIAELGSSGTNVNNLHFEIRKNGKPVNPLNYVKP